MRSFYARELRLYIIIYSSFKIFYDLDNKNFYDHWTAIFLILLSIWIRQLRRAETCVSICFITPFRLVVFDNPSLLTWKINDYTTVLIQYMYYSYSFKIHLWNKFCRICFNKIDDWEFIVIANLLFIYQLYKMIFYLSSIVKRPIPKDV